MPFSNSEQISPILSEIKQLQPRTILDVGCGLGLYGFLCRIYLDLYDDVNFYDKLKDEEKKRWTVTIDAIEGFEDYVRFIPRWAYDDIMVGNARDILPIVESKKYDLVLSLAILEHLTKEEGLIFLKELKRVGRKIIVTVPKEWREQTVPDNPFETHKSHWTDNDLREWGFNKFLPHWGAWIALYDPDRKGVVQIEEAERASNHIECRMDEIERSIKILKNKLNVMINLQNSTIDRLSFSLRIKSLMNRLKSFFPGRN